VCVLTLFNYFFFFGACVTTSWRWNQKMYVNRSTTWYSFWASSRPRSAPICLRRRFSSSFSIFSASCRFACYRNSEQTSVKFYFKQFEFVSSISVLCYRLWWIKMNVKEQHQLRCTPCLQKNCRLFNPLVPDFYQR